MTQLSFLNRGHCVNHLTSYDMSVNIQFIFQRTNSKQSFLENDNCDFLVEIILIKLYRLSFEFDLVFYFFYFFYDCFTCVVSKTVIKYCIRYIFLQGRPSYLGEFECSFYFEWESFHFCKDLPKPTNQIPCFIYNNASKLIDLSPLTKLKGGYLVSSENGRDFYINVCRDLTPGKCN